MAQFQPNTSNGPCIYCKKSHAEFVPEDLVKCELCRRAAHFECLSLTSPIKRLLGDNFFNLTCRHCTHENYDKLSRVDLKILHVILLVFYNLHMTVKSIDGFYHYERHVSSFISQRIGEISADSRRNMKKFKKSALSTQIVNHPQFFSRRHGSKGRDGGWYRLNYVLPPAQILLKQSKDKLDSKKKAFNFDQTVNSNVVDMNCLKEEVASSSKLLDSPYDSIDDSSSRGSWFTEKEYLRPDNLLPESIFEDDEKENKKIEVCEVDEETTPIKVEALDPDDEGPAPTPTKVSLFQQIKQEPSEASDGDEVPPPAKKAKVEPLSIYEEKQLLLRLNEQYKIEEKLPPDVYRLRAKLILRSKQREHNVPVFDVDSEVEFLQTHGRIRTRKEKLEHQIIKNNQTNLLNERILDRFQIGGNFPRFVRTDKDRSFKEKLMGNLGDPKPVYSPYTLRTLKPFIYRDTESLPRKLDLLLKIQSHPHRKDPDWTPPPRHPIDFCYVTPKHIPAINSLARNFFWPGIELSEILQYPDYTCVVQYRGLVIGFGVIVPDINMNEAYISFLLVHPEWQGAGIGKFILYHLIQTCMGKDITLHVSASNPAVILYQKFGFKVEEFLKDFYDKYFSIDSEQCRHAMYMRLKR